ncbi:PTS system mannose/fructose/N-acetylgalactosamine-transporter subunit IIB [Latilactobacillus sakei]|uniref:PTS system mannose/fructose/N-acetylgalactosamine-transporter subunit IIB n=1 Tax=Latilactobacillus sakei TaxID=1599 RepID=UPI00388A7BA7
MINMVRIDDRLIHGQVAVKWSKELGISRIVVISDKIATNEIQISALKMAAPAGVKAAISPLDKAIKILNDPRSEALKILVVTNDPKYVAGLVPQLTQKPRLNIANYGRIGGVLSDKRKVTETVYLSETDEQIFQEMFADGYDFTYQPLPSDPEQSLNQLLGGH